MPPRRSKKRTVVDIDPPNDESSWKEQKRNLSDFVFDCKNLSKSQKRAQLMELNGRGYTAIMLDDYCMHLLEDGSVQETLSNMLKYGSRNDGVNGTQLVFQKPGVSANVPELSRTR